MPLWESYFNSDKPAIGNFLAENPIAQTILLHFGK